MKKIKLTLILALLASQGFAVVAERIKVNLWQRGESIAGEEFLTANESIEDYLATLPRPSEPLKAASYMCMVKSRAISPSVMHFGSGGNQNEFVVVRMVYDMRDCQPKN